MCNGTHHNHAGSHDAHQQPVDTIEVYISPSGVIRITTGEMQTAHATIGDAIEAFCRLAGVTIEQAEPVIKSLEHEHRHEREAIRGR